MSGSGPEMDAVSIGLITVAITQLIGVMVILVNGWNARRAIAAAAQLTDERAARDRQWALEDRRALAADLAAKVQATADTLAAKVEADHTTLGHKVEHATVTASLAVKDIAQAIDVNTALTQQAADAAREAYREANHVNQKIAAIGELRQPTTPVAGGEVLTQLQAIEAHTAGTAAALKET